jgi:hypothetical protein
LDPIFYRTLFYDFRLVMSPGLELNLVVLGINIKRVAQRGSNILCIESDR